MIIARTTGKPPALVIGLSRKNCEELLKGRPIFKNESDMPLPIQLVIAGGETLEEVQSKLEEVFGPIGPDPVKSEPGQEITVERLVSVTVSEIKEAIEDGIRHFDKHGKDLITVEDVLVALKRDGTFGFDPNGKETYKKKSN